MKVVTRCLFAVCLLAGWATPSAAQPDANLNVRVSITFENARALQVMTTLATAASLSLAMSDEGMSPVTITLTNATVRTALDAVCENAGCKWSVIDGNPATLKVIRTNVDRKLDIKANVSVHLKSAVFEQAFRTLASYLQMEIVIDGKLPVKSVTLQVREGTTTTLLDALCKAAQCTWRIEPEAKRLVISAK